MDKQSRNSNFELLRIVSMMFIVVHHFLIASEAVDYSHLSLRGGEMVNGFVVVGVNCFILISGYFGIRLKLEKIFYLFFCIAAVLVADFCLNNFCGSAFCFSYAARQIIPFSSRANWFVPAYIALMCFAPLLNRGLERMDKSELSNTVLILTVVNIYAYATGIASISPNGYSLVQFVYLYIVGAWLVTVDVRRSWIPFVAYIVCALSTGVVALVYKSGFTAFAYNSPLVLASSVAFFLCFKKLSIQKRWINAFAKSTFIVFLFHYVILYYVKSLAIRNDPMKYLFIVAIYVSIFVCSFLLSLPINRGWQFILRRVVKN